MMKIAFRLVAIFFTLLNLHSDAQQYSYIQHNVKEGLVQSQVRCVYQDSSGFIWAGTLGGISRFDGRIFVNYDRRDGLPGNQVNCIHELADRTIVTGFNGNIAFINADRIETLSLGSNWSDATVNCIWGKNKNYMMIGTEKGIFILRNNEISGPFLPSFEDGANIRSIIEHKEKILVISRGGIAEMKETKFIEYFIPPTGITLFDAVSVVDTLWIGTKDMGLVKLVNDVIQAFGPAEGLESTTITGLMYSQQQAQLYLTSRFGFYKFNGKNFKAFDESNGLPTPDVKDMLEDKEGNIWVATYGSGLLRFTGEDIYAYTTKDGLSSNAVMSITADSEQAGSYWISTYDKGICRLTNDTVTSYPLSEMTDNNRIWTSVTTQSGETWFGSSDGLFLYRNGKFLHYTEIDGIPDRMVLSLLETEDGIIWMGTAKGLGKIQNGQFSIVDRTPRTRIRSIARDLSGVIWLATLEGVFSYDGYSFKVYTEKDGLPEKSTYCIEVDAFNHIWVGTQNGVALWTDGQFALTNVDDLAGANTINFMRSHARELWVGTNNGLYHTLLVQNMDASNIRFEHYGLNEGLRSLETNLNSGFIDVDGNVWFGTTDGVMRLNKKKTDSEMSNLAPDIVLTSILLNLENIEWANWKGVTINKANGLPVDLKVDHKHNHFTFHFTGISHSHPEDIQYQYMLEGFDEDWQSLTSNGFATYSNLPYDNFTFKVRSIGRGQKWSEPILYNFQIEPPFWYTWWFISLEILVGMGMVWNIVRWRRKTLITRHEKEKFEMRSKMLALEQESLNSSMNRHFIFNALNSIQYYINRQDRLSANKYLSDFAKLIRKNLDSSSDNLTTLRDELERLELYLRLEHMRFKDKFAYSIHVDENLDQDAVKVPAMLLQPFLENSIWHGILPKNIPGRVDVNVEKNGDSIEFTITDDGIGIDSSLRNKSGSDSHISKGMAITSGRIDLIKLMTSQHIELLGPYELLGNEGQTIGTQVRIVLPANFNELFSN
ncbi:MAG: two-component regulator propeller domain-containing protein [Flavobacteriales bacterium]|nr:two-component regulator propeller domain-containing protein [Flavobacteriales bacterium]